jgi:predicted DNA-binding WGR domain protein
LQSADLIRAFYEQDFVIFEPFPQRAERTVPMSRYELIEGTSRKFWDVSVRGTRVVVNWGRIGTEGQSKTFELPTAAAAGERRAKLIREKTAKGYQLVESTRSVAAPARALPARGTASKANTAAKGRARPASLDKQPGPRARLRAAFAALNSMGIVAIENAGYTQSDGWDDVNEAAGKLADSGKRPRAGVFYHGQDVARGKRGEGLSLTFGSYAEQNADADSVAVGHVIVDVLEAHGFQPTWDGTLSTRIHTGRFDWK